MNCVVHVARPAALSAPGGHRPTREHLASHAILLPNSADIFRLKRPAALACFAAGAAETKWRFPGQWRAMH
jgi:hypothetical protein